MSIRGKGKTISIHTPTTTEEVLWHLSSYCISCSNNWDEHEDGNGSPYPLGPYLARWTESGNHILQCLKVSKNLAANCAQNNGTLAMISYFSFLTFQH